MTAFKYSLGSVDKLSQLYPNPEFAYTELNFSSYSDVIRHYTSQSLKADGIQADRLEVNQSMGQFEVVIESSESQETLATFAERHIKLFSKQYAQKAITGKLMMEQLNVWNPMEGYHVNRNPEDGKSKWELFPPLGLNIIGQKGLLCMHYPPWAVLQAGTFDNAMTMQRWERMLVHSGVPEKDVPRYKTIVDVNPIAAPGSGESEYPNDYMPIMMASGFFDGPPDRDYIKSMLDIYLNPPGLPADRKYTIPLIICGSPLYDPQAPGWFRTAYTDILPQDENHIPQVNVLQTGKFRVFPDSERETPYMIANHMIAAGVTGKCTNDPAKIPDIRQYEAQDLVAASFLKLYDDDPTRDPEDVKREACMRWYGNEKGEGAPNPPDDNDKATICALAQMDLFFEPSPKPHPKYSFEEALHRCKTLADPLDDPCGAHVRPTGWKGGSKD